MFTSAGLMGAARVLSRTEVLGMEGEMEWVCRLGSWRLANLFFLYGD
jgi:hypothetical protein